MPLRTSFTPVLVTVGCTSPAATDATPSTLTNVAWDTFYDITGSTIGSLPATLGMSYSSGTLTLTGSGVWVFNVGVDLITAPGSTGRIRLYSNGAAAEEIQSYPILAAANPALMTFQRTWALEAGSVIRLQQDSVGSSITQIDSYAQIQIIRLATSVG